MSGPAQADLELVLFDLGLVGLAGSDSVFAYLVASGADTMPPIANAGFIAGPVLIMLAALAPGAPVADPPRRPAGVASSGSTCCCRTCPWSAPERSPSAGRWPEGGSARSRRTLAWLSSSWSYCAR